MLKTITGLCLGVSLSLASMPLAAQMSFQFVQPHNRRVVQRLSRFLNTRNIRVISVRNQVWADGCLGLADPTELCTPGPVNGYQIVGIVEGRQRVFRADQTLRSIREEGQRMSLSPLIQLLGNGQIRILKVTPQTWPDGCLGLPHAGEMCTMALVEGYRVEAMVNGQKKVFRTNRDFTAIREENKPL